VYGPGARGEETRQDLLATSLVQAKEQRRADLTRRRGERKYRVVVVVVVVMMDDEERGCRSFDHQKARSEAREDPARVQQAGSQKGVVRPKQRTPVSEKRGKGRKKLPASRCNTTQHNRQVSVYRNKHSSSRYCSALLL